MSDIQAASSPAASSTSSSERLDAIGKTVSKYIAIVTALISVAVPLTEWVRGMSNQRIKEIEQNSALAVTYLDKIASKETSSPDRVMYLSALATLRDHPLQTWAAEQLGIQRKLVDDLNKIVAKGHEAMEASNETQAQLGQIEKDLQIVGLKLQQAATGDEHSSLENQYTKLIFERNKLRATLLEQAKEASSAADAAVLAATSNQGAAPEFLSALKDLRLAAINSETARRLSIDNAPTAEHEAALNYVLEAIAQPVERHFGKRVEIVSGYRAPDLTKAVGASPTSSHSRGEAIDIRVPGESLLAVACWIRDSGLLFDQLILETQVVHVSARQALGENRRQVFRQPGGPGTPTSNGIHGCPGA